MSDRLRRFALAFVAAFAFAGVATSAWAAEESGFDESRPYLGGSVFWHKPDSSRNMEDGVGSRAVIGTRLKSGLMLEGNLFGLQGSRDVGSGKDSSWGVGGDFLFPFTESGFRPFVLAGGGYINEKVQGSREGAGYANAGVGALIPLSSHLSLRAEGRYVAVFNDFAAGPNDDPLYDVQVGLGLQAALGTPKPKVVDSDLDGVLDPADQCPNTPAGVTVGFTGCPLDSDRDGVADYLDKCPNTPAAAPVNAQGCPVDADGDAVADHLDKCPNTPRGAPVNASGCPLDADRDGVADYLDKCPNTPFGLKVDAQGCVARTPQTIVLQNVNFEFNKAVLTAGSRQVLSEVASGLKSDAQLRIEIAGHTDSVGSDVYNKRLSQGRADSVRAFLISQGVDASRLIARGYGEESPAASNDNEEGRAQNRRVEFRVLSR